MSEKITKYRVPVVGLGLVGSVTAVLVDKFQDFDAVTYENTSKCDKETAKAVQATTSSLNFRVHRRKQLNYFDLFIFFLLLNCTWILFVGCIVAVYLI
jgi:hypothetical protein